MKLDNNTIQYIDRVVNVAQLVGIDNIIIEPGVVRGVNDDVSVVILQKENVEDLPFGSIGLNRLKIFKSRYDTAKTQENFSIKATLADGKPGVDDCARSLILTGKGMKIDYRCANPTKMKSIPKQIKDDRLLEFKMTGEAVLLFEKGMVAMGAEHVLLLSNGGMSFEFTDTNNDVFSYQFTDETTDLSGENPTPKIAYRYPAKTVLQLFKQNPTGTLTIGGRIGTLCAQINGLSVHVIPQA